jgi:hypothetical protein
MSLTPIGAVLGYLDACDHAGAVLSRNEANGGVGMWCDGCRSWVTTQLGYDRMWLGKDHPALAAVDLAALPLVRARIWRKCQGPCASLTHCEYHHMAPQSPAYFGPDEADRWPTAWLCRPCHERWHTIVTPGLCTPHDPERHARQLLDYLGTERAARLTRALTIEGRARRAEEAA